MDRYDDLAEMPPRPALPRGDGSGPPRPPGKSSRNGRNGLPAAAARSGAGRQ